MVPISFTKDELNDLAWLVSKAIDKAVDGSPGKRRLQSVLAKFRKADSQQ
jgi:hypothetical protein